MLNVRQVYFTKMKNSYIFSRLKSLIVLLSVCASLLSCSSSQATLAYSVYDDLLEQYSSFVSYDDETVSCNIVDDQIKISYIGEQPITFSTCRYEEGLNGNGEVRKIAIVSFRSDPSEHIDENAATITIDSIDNIDSVYYISYVIEGDHMKATSIEIPTQLWCRKNTTQFS